MLRPSVTQEWVGEGELPRERTKFGDGGGPTICMIRSYWELYFDEQYNEKDWIPWYRSDGKGCGCEATDSRAMGLAVPWYRRGGTSLEASIPCSHEGRVLVAKGTVEVKNAEANSKYQDRAEGQRPRNFIRPVSTGFSSR
ncbi:hypothetical protein BHE74_00059496 [Ensete ventricosum]|nr:hypothetical protein BHE74_00059496 [Ensete ventricosum]